MNSLFKHSIDWNFVVVSIIFCMRYIGRIDFIGRLFIYHSQCLNYVANTTLCDNLDEYPDEEAHVQTESARYIMYFVLLYQLPSSFVGLLCGAWSDTVGRKWSALTSPLGAVFTFMCFALSTVVQSERIYIPLILIGAALFGLLGDATAMSLNSYVTDTSKQEERTVKISKLQAMSSFGTFIGTLMFGGLLELLSFTTIFCVLIAINGSCIAFTLAFMDNIPPTKNVDDHDKIDHDDNHPDSHGCTSNSLFHWNNVTNSIQVLIIARENNGRSQLLVFLVIIMVFQLCKAGEANILVLFVQASPLSFDKSSYGYIRALDFLCLALVVLLLVPQLVMLFNVDDTTLLLIGTLMSIIRLLIVSFSTRTWMVYFGIVIGCPCAMIPTAVKSIISKIVRVDEVGKVFSMFSIIQMLCNILGTLIYTNVYAVTLNVFRGMSFIVMAIMQLTTFIILIYVVKDMKDQWLNKFLQKLGGRNTSEEALNSNEEETPIGGHHTTYQTLDDRH